MITFFFVVVVVCAIRVRRDLSREEEKMVWQNNDKSRTSRCFVVEIAAAVLISFSGSKTE